MDSYVLPDDDLKTILKRIASSKRLAGDFEIQWHAGEPLAAGLPFYQRALETLRAIEREYSIKISQSIQTNSTLINSKWCEFLAQNDIGVGISIDGPAALHDRHRRSWSNKPSHAKTMSGCEQLRKHGIHPAALAVVTEQTLSCPETFLDFFIENGFTKIGFNTEEIENANSQTSLDVDNIETRYYSFIRRLFRHWVPHRDRIRIREFDTLVSVLDILRSDKNFVRVPNEAILWQIVTINKRGNVFLYCPEFAGIHAPQFNNFIVGNILSQDLDEIADSSHRTDISHAIETSTNLCRTQCGYYQVCGGAFFSNKWAEHKKLDCTQTRTCRLHIQTMTDAVLDELAILSTKGASQHDRPN